MTKFIKQGDLIFGVECRESYNKTLADKTARGLSDEEMDTTFIQGFLQVKSVSIIQEQYQPRAVELTRNQVLRLSKFVREIEATECKQSLTDYYS